MPSSPFSEADLEQLAERGVTADEAQSQLARFSNRPRPAPLVRACSLGDGIRTLPESDELRRLAHDAIAGGRLTKFVPASGAASRMFQSLASLQGQDDPTTSRAFLTLRDSLERFAFFQQLVALLEPRHPADLSPVELLDAVLGRSLPDHAEQPSLGLAQRPKGLIPFHRDDAGLVRTAFEEHLVEGALLSRAATGSGELECRAHFTISEEHRSDFESLLERCRAEIENSYGVRLVVDFSTQDRATDTLAGNFDGTPFRVSSDADSPLLFRPGGHGALIGNLSRLARRGADLVTIKNIDNIRPVSAQPVLNQIRLDLIGLTAQLTATAHQLLAELDQDASRASLQRAVDFLVDGLERPAESFDAKLIGDAEQQALRRSLIRELDRPLRVCGMVVNHGEPGGGPFWVADDERGASCQIVESAQIDRSIPAQNEIVESATHFNPVELICSLRDWRGEPFDLEDFVDHESWFVAEKSKDGRDLLALERPGLWNGAMGRWNTVFVEIPSAMFAPVKTVLDLLREEHQDC